MKIFMNSLSESLGGHMATQGSIQPNIIEINTNLRLRKFDGNYDITYEWYQDIETVRLVDGENAITYDMEKIKKMYDYLDNHGELYFIEMLDNDTFMPIGDVTLYQENMPIVIGDKRFRNKGIGNLVIRAMIQRAKAIGYKTIYVNEIYHYNYSSRALFEKNGFVAYKSTNSGSSFKLDLSE